MKNDEINPESEIGEIFEYLDNNVKVICTFQTVR